jgi:hypothetical protein
MIACGSEDTTVADRDDSAGGPDDVSPSADAAGADPDAGQSTDGPSTLYEEYLNVVRITCDGRASCEPESFFEQFDSVEECVAYYGAAWASEYDVAGDYSDDCVNSYQSLVACFAETSICVETDYGDTDFRRDEYECQAIIAEMYETCYLESE